MKSNQKIITRVEGEGGGLEGKRESEWVSAHKDVVVEEEEREKKKRDLISEK